jgi:hypothetical protein
MSFQQLISKSTLHSGSERVKIRQRGPKKWWDLFQNKRLSWIINVWCFMMCSFLWQIKTIILSPETTTGFEAITIILQTIVTQRLHTMSVRYNKKDRDMKEFWESMLACMKWFHTNNVCYHPKMETRLATNYYESLKTYINMSLYIFSHCYLG